MSDYTISAKCGYSHFAPFNGLSSIKIGTFDCKAVYMPQFMAIALFSSCGRFSASDSQLQAFMGRNPAGLADESGDLLAKRLEAAYPSIYGQALNILPQ
jgi:hypothetical protein